MDLKTGLTERKIQVLPRNSFTEKNKFQFVGVVIRDMKIISLTKDGIDQT